MDEKAPLGEVAANSPSDEALLNEIAAVLADTARLGAKRQIEQLALPMERVDKAFKVACAEADRSASILLFALVEDLMLDALKLHLNPNVKGGWKALTDGGGLLATASDRIILLELLYWIAPGTGGDLRLMKSIRNRFAHHAEVNSFEDKTISGWITSMTDYENTTVKLFTKRKELAEAPGLTLQDRFLLRALGTIWRLVRDLAIAPIAMQNRVSVNTLMQAPFDEMPENVKQALFYDARMQIEYFNAKIANIPSFE